jgi:hypothetical protein
VDQVLDKGRKECSKAGIHFLICLCDSTVHRSPEFKCTGYVGVRCALRGTKAGSRQLLVRAHIMPFAINRTPSSRLPRYRSDFATKSSLFRCPFWEHLPHSRAVFVGRTGMRSSDRHPPTRSGRRLRGCRTCRDCGAGCQRPHTVWPASGYVCWCMASLCRWSLCFRKVSSFF